MFTVVLAVTGDVRTLNDALVAPSGIVTVNTVGAATAVAARQRRGGSTGGRCAF